LSSRNKPSSRCSVSMYGEPNWLASYLAKKITRLAFSVYRSNIFPSPRCSQSPLPETSLYLSGCELRTPPERSLSVLPALSITREHQIAAPDKSTSAKSAEKPKNCPSPLLASSAIRAALPLLCRDATAIHDRSDAQIQGCG